MWKKSERAKREISRETGGRLSPALQRSHFFLPQPHNSVQSIPRIDFFKKSIWPLCKYYDCLSILGAEAPKNTFPNILSLNIILSFILSRRGEERSRRLVGETEGDTRFQQFGSSSEIFDISVWAAQLQFNSGPPYNSCWCIPTCMINLIFCTLKTKVVEIIERAFFFFFLFENRKYVNANLFAPCLPIINRKWNK